MNIQGIEYALNSCNACDTIDDFCIENDMGYCRTCYNEVTGEGGNINMSTTFELNSNQIKIVAALINDDRARWIEFNPPPSSVVNVLQANGQEIGEISLKEALNLAFIYETREAVKI